MVSSGFIDRGELGDYHIGMFNAARSRAPRTAFCVLAVMLHVVFAILAALPQVVFCHRAGGSVAVEFAGPSGVCLCDECEHCMERLAEARAGTLPGVVSLEACHCRHELILLEAARSCFLRDKAKSGIAPDFVSAASPAILPDLLQAGLAPASTVSFSTPAFPGGATLLRC